MIILAYEMGLTRREILSLTLSEFNLMWMGYKRRNEKDWDIARRTWSYIISYAGMGLKKNAKVPKPNELWALEYTDKKEDETVRIKTVKQAIDLLNTF